MLRIGIFTGKTYPKDVDPDSIRECILAFIDVTPPTEEHIKEWLTKYQTWCIGCHGCEEAREVLDR